MTVQNQNVKNVYRGNGSTTVFPFTFAINESHPEYIHVYITNDGGKAAETTDFTCDMETRTITYPKVSSSAPKLSATQRLTIYRLLPYEQNLNLVNQGPFFSEDVETQLDDLEMQIQQLNEESGRRLQVGLEVDGFDTTVPIEAGKTFRVKDDGTGFELTEDPKAAREAAEAAQAATEHAQGIAENARDDAEAAAALTELQAVWFDNVAALRAADIPVGMTAGTKGYYAMNDGGAAVYAVREHEISDVDDGGSVIFLDNGKVAELIVGNTVYPQQFGAYCDREHDDSGALQNAVNYVASKSNGIGVTINKDMIIDATITVPMNVDISADINSNRFPLLYITPNCAKVFDCIDKQNSFNAIRIKPTPSAYRDDLIGWDFHGDESYNVDSALINCGVQLMHKGVVCRGRNLRIYNSFFGHCKYGVYYDFPVGATQLRGCEIKNVRFHGIGEEADLKFVDCSAIYMKSNAGTNITIQDCICDQGGTFFEGYASVMLMQGNFVESFAGPLLKCDLPVGTTVADWNITGNVFKGKSGTTTYGETAGLPENLIYLKNKNRVSFTNNTLSYSQHEGVVLDSVTNSLFSGNTFRVLSASDFSRRVAFLLSDCSENSISDNMSTDDSTTIVLAKSADSSSAFVGGNNVRFSGISGVTQLQTDNFYSFATITAGTETNLTYNDIPNGRYHILSSVLGGSWVMTKNGSYVNITPSTTPSRIDYMNISKNTTNDKLTFSVKRFTISGETWTDVTGALVINKIS